MRVLEHTVRGTLLLHEPIAPPKVEAPPLAHVGTIGFDGSQQSVPSTCGPGSIIPKQSRHSTDGGSKEIRLKVKKVAVRLFDKPSVRQRVLKAADPLEAPVGQFLF